MDKQRITEFLIKYCRLLKKNNPNKIHTLSKNNSLTYQNDKVLNYKGLYRFYTFYRPPYKKNTEIIYIFIYKTYHGKGVLHT